MLVPLGAVFCCDEPSPCWDKIHGQPAWARRALAPAMRAAHLARERDRTVPRRRERTPLRAEDVYPVRTHSVVLPLAVFAALQATWDAVSSLARDVHRAQISTDDAQRQLARGQAELAEFRRPVSDAAAAPPPADRAAGVRFLLEHLLARRSFVTAVAGAPSMDELIALVHLAFPCDGGRPTVDTVCSATWRSPGWKSRIVDPLHATVVALAHLRGAVSFEALAAEFFLSHKSAAFRHTRRVVKRLAALATGADAARGAVRFLTDAELRPLLPPHFATLFPNLRLLADTLAFFVDWPAACNPLNHRLYDGTQYQGRWWVKFLLAVAPNGYVMHVGGPYAPAGKACDGRVLTYELLGDDAFWQFACAGGTWLVDYGFRGVRVPPAVTVHMPKKWPTQPAARIPPRQGTREEINHNDRITAVRWVVESANERVRNWGIFAGGTRPVVEIASLRRLLTVACFLNNRWYKPIVQWQRA